MIDGAVVACAVRWSVVCGVLLLAWAEAKRSPATPSMHKHSREPTPRELYRLPSTLYTVPSRRASAVRSAPGSGVGPYTLQLYITLCNN